MLELKDIKSVLNVGSGQYFAPHDLWEELFKADAKVALDCNIKRIMTWVNTGWVPMMADGRRIDDFFIKNSFDIVIATDFIEHLSRGEGKKFLRRAEEIARKAVIIFTPEGFLDTEKYQAADVKTPFDIHHSGWTQKDFEDLGYKTETIKDLHNFGDVSFNAFWAWKEL